MEVASFLNLDLDLRSKTDLAPLAKHLDRFASLLHSGNHSGEFRITAESLIGGHPSIDPAACTRELLETLTALPVALRTLFDSCHLRIFDYGFDGGLEASPYSVDLPASQLLQMAQMGIDLRVTVYPHRTDPAIEKETEVDA